MGKHHLVAFKDIHYASEIGPSSSILQIIRQCLFSRLTTFLLTNAKGLKEITKISYRKLFMNSYVEKKGVSIKITENFEKKNNLGIKSKKCEHLKKKRHQKDENSNYFNKLMKKNRNKENTIIIINLIGKFFNF